MCATLLSEGTVPESMDFWNKTVRTPHSSSAHIFNNFPGKPSGPGALFSLMPKRSFSMPLRLIEILLIWAAEPCGSAGGGLNGVPGVDKTLENWALNKLAF